MSNFALYGGVSARSPDIANSKPYKYTITSQTSTPLIDLTTLKQALNINNDIDDVILNLYLSSATSYVENFTKQEYLEKVFLTYRDYFDYSNQYNAPVTNYDNFLLTKSNICAINSFQYLVDNVFIDVPSDRYYIIDEGDYKRIVLNNNKQYPQNKDDKLQSIKIEFTCKPTIINNDIINAIMMIVADLYANRGDCNCDNNTINKSYVSNATRGILLQNKIIRI